MVGAQSSRSPITVAVADGMPHGIPEMGIGVLLRFRCVMDSKSVLIYLFLYVLCVCRSISSGKLRRMKPPSET